MIFRSFHFLCFLAASGFAASGVGPTAAQGLTAEQFAATLAADLELPTGTSSPESLTRGKTTLLAPAGNGPFPAVVILHQCGGLNPTVFEHAREALSRGYVALVLDALKPRQVDSVCYGPRNGVNFFRGARDALLAADHLRTLPNVDPARVALVGFSWGAMVGLITASGVHRNNLRIDSAFDAVVAHYPGCFSISAPEGRRYEILNEGIDVRTLMLMGELDLETPAEECVRKLQPLLAHKAPIESHIYPGLTHCWNCKQIDGRRKIDARGTVVSYQYDAAATADATDRTFEFLQRAMPAKPK